MADDGPGVLIVDDEFSVRDSLESWLRKEGYRVGTAQSGSEALLRLQEASWDVILLDIRMPGMDGLELQDRVREIAPQIMVIIITGYAMVQTAVEALKKGAYDYVTKPIDPDQLNHLVRNAAERQRLTAENARLRANIDGLAGIEEIVGQSPQMREVVQLVQSAAGSDAPVLIHGAAGTGREHVARVIHTNSRRRYFPIVPVSCVATAQGTLRNDLLGRETVALPEGRYPRKGKFEMADGGTLFFDEIAAVDLESQVALAATLDRGQFTRVDGSKPVDADFRLICATEQNLERLVKAGKFFGDLYYRISVITIDLPPLRERVSDIPLLARHFLAKYATRMSRSVVDIEDDAINALIAHDWPGNVRELANTIERALVVGKDSLLRRHDLPAWPTASPAATGGATLAQVERNHIAAILESTGWDTARAAEILGIDRETLNDRIARYGLRE